MLATTADYQNHNPEYFIGTMYSMSMLKQKRLNVYYKFEINVQKAIQTPFPLFSKF